MQYIVTHHGRAHRDEFIACALLLAEYGHVNPTIFRRAPSEEELQNPEVLVVDVGEQFDIAKGNLDHHQYDRTAPARCSITQVLEYLGHDPEAARGIWPWLEFAEWLDSKGPELTAKRLGIPADNMIQCVSPVEQSLIAEFAKCVEITSSSLLWQIMQLIGKQQLLSLHAVTTRLRMLPELSFVENVFGINVLVLDQKIKDQPTLAVELYIKRSLASQSIAVVVSRDEREDGLSLFRRNDSKIVPLVDFSNVEKEPGVRFAHKMGFIAKVTADADWRRLIKIALDSNWRSNTPVNV